MNIAGLCNIYCKMMNIVELCIYKWCIFQKCMILINVIFVHHYTPCCYGDVLWIYLYRNTRWDVVYELDIKFRIQKLKNESSIMIGTIMCKWVSCNDEDYNKKMSLQKW